MPTDAENGLDSLADALRKPGAYPLVVTGAGISLASGIPTFRGTDPGAVYSIDPAAPPPDARGVKWIAEPSETSLPRLVQGL